MKIFCRKNRKYIIDGIVIVLVVLFTLFYLIKGGYFTAEKLSVIDFYDFLIVSVYCFLALALLSLVDFLVYRTFTRQMPYYKCLFNTVSGNLGSGVTPYKTGHFPLMIYYQINSGVPYRDTAAGLIKCQIIYSFTSVAVYTVAVIVLAAKGLFVTINGVSVPLWAVISLGLLFHIGVAVLIAVLAFIKPLQEKVLSLTANVIKKFKKDFDKDKFIAEKSEKLGVYRREISLIAGGFYKFIPAFLFYAVFMIMSSSSAYLSYLLASHNKFDFDTMLIFYILVLASAYITNFVPIPGGVGSSEIIFTLIFASVIPDEFMGAVLVLWRVGSFYLLIIIDLILFVISHFFRQRKNKENLAEN